MYATLSEIIARFSARDASRTASTCRVQLLPKIVTIGVSASRRAFRLASSPG
jgi:hypothetical protein